MGRQQTSNIDDLEVRNGLTTEVGGLNSLGQVINSLFQFLARPKAWDMLIGYFY